MERKNPNVEKKIKKLVFSIFLVSLFLCCGPKGEKVDRIVEDGVEVVLNHLEPYKIKGEYSTLTLEEELKIDFENKEFEDLGLRMPEFVEADSKGNIYLVDRNRSSEYFICRFDKEGKLIKNIGRKGQGPGEIQRIHIIKINSQDNILISDTGNMKILELDKEGTLIKETRVLHGLREVIPLENGNYLARRGTMEGMSLCLYNSSFEEIKKLDFYDTSEMRKSRRTTGTIFSFYWRATEDKIYVGNEQRGYEILVYDLDGNLLRKIRKEFTRAKYPEEFSKQTEKMAETNPNIYSLEFTPPFNSFFIDDDGWLFVMTYERGENKDEYIHDIYNSNGAFIGRRNIGISYMLGRALNHLRATAKNSRYYRLRYKEYGGYVELIVYKMI